MLEEKQLESTLVWFDGGDIADDHEGWLAAKSIRIEVFVGEQACPITEEFDGFDGECRHLLMTELGAGDAGQEIGTARWRVVEWEGESAAKLERFAVRRSHRGAGVGQRLVEAVLEDAGAAGHRRFLLHSQEYLVDFYRAFGFITIGERFVEGGTPHRRMVKDDS